MVRATARVGVHVISIAHFRSFLADGSGLDDTSRSRPLPQGIEALAEMERLAIVFDISHLGLAGVDHVLELATRPLLAAHSACLPITDIHRNLGDEQIKGIARLGGVVGVSAASLTSSTFSDRPQTGWSTTSPSSPQWGSTTSHSGRTLSRTTSNSSTAVGDLCPASTARWLPPRSPDRRTYPSSPRRCSVADSPRTTSARSRHQRAAGPRVTSWILRSSEH